MRKCYRLMVCIVVLCGLALLPAIASAKETTTKKAAKPKSAKSASPAVETKLPDAVKKTFDDKFPNAKIDKSTAEKEGGVNVYDIEFREGRTHKETDIAEDGTMLEYTVYVAKKTVPKEAMKVMDAAAKEKSAKMGHIEKIEVTHETKDGKVVKLEKPQTHYAVEMTKDDKTAEIVVDAKGKVVEEPKWDATKAKEKKPAV